MKTARELVAACLGEVVPVIHEDRLPGIDISAKILLKTANRCAIE